jgi:predicted ATPase/DNA-binding winged helix-turn-helix (wHTH) protein
LAPLTEYRFGDFRLLPQEQQLLRGDAAVALTARAFSLLLALVEAAGRLVSKDALMERVWMGLVVEENNLAVQIGVLRKLLGADAIATVPGRGYRFALALQGVRAVEPAAHAGGNLPAAVAPLLGREADLVALKTCMDQQRLVTVVGAGGIGKSRLALAAGSASRGRWRDGVWWLELAGLGEASLLASSMAQTLGINLQGRESGPAALAAALADREVLLVIDNCEHLLDAVAAVVDQLLKGAPGLRVLATSQEPLRLAAEQQYRLNPLAVPADASTPGSREFGALALLVSRVRASQAGYALSDHDLPLAIELCRRLDGLPLAIELAAARIPLLGLRTVHDRLDERFRLLTAGSRMALRRHQTLRAAIDWSHGLLDDGQRAVFMRLGVFSGGFTIGLAQALCADGQLDEWAVLDQVAALVDKSLVVLDGSAGQRYRLLESARAYSLEHLAGAQLTLPALRRHAQTMLDFLRRVDDANMDGELRTDEYAAQVLPELDNLRAAQAWATGTDGDRAIAIGLAAHVSPLIDYSLEFVDWMLGQRPHIAAGVVDEATAARFWRGLAASNMFGYVAMIEQLEAAQRAAELYRTMDRPKHLFSALRRASVWAGQLQDDVRAKRAADESEALLQSDWGPGFRIEVLRGRSYLADRQGDLDTAIALRQEAACVARDVFGDWRLQIIDETFVADLLWRAGRRAEAAELLAGLIEGMQLRPASDYELLDAIETQLWILSDLGDLPAATALARSALPVMRRMPRFALIGCAHLLMRLGRFEDAARVLGAQTARTRAGLAPSLPPGLSALDRLQAETQAGVEAALAPADLAGLLKAGEALGYGDVCDLLANAVQPAGRLL